MSFCVIILNKVMEMKNFKKILFVILAIILFVIFVFIMHGYLYRNVAIYYNENEKPKIIEVRKGKKIKNLETPIKDGYVFIGWYNLENEEAFDISNDVVNDDLALTPGWAKIAKNSD